MTDPNKIFNIGNNDLTPIINPDQEKGNLIGPNHKGFHETINNNKDKNPLDIPPGARFDPFDPPTPDFDNNKNDKKIGPNPDHFKPPDLD